MSVKDEKYLFVWIVFSCVRGVFAFLPDSCTYTLWCYAKARASFSGFNLFEVINVYCILYTVNVHFEVITTVYA